MTADKAMRAMLPLRISGKSWRGRILADAALARGERVGELYVDTEGKVKVRDYKPLKRRAREQRRLDLASNVRRSKRRAELARRRR